MEIAVFPQGFQVMPTQVNGPTGPQDAMQLVLVEPSGIAVKAVFPLEAWEQFKRFVQDPEAETARAAARSKIVVGPTLAPSVKSRLQ